MKYQTLEQLQAAYESGELQPGEPVTIDRWSGYLWIGNEGARELAFNMPVRDLIAQALALLRIPNADATR